MTGTEDLLRAAMARFTEDVRVPSGQLAGHAGQPRAEGEDLGPRSAAHARVRTGRDAGAQNGHARE